MPLTSESRIVQYVLAGAGQVLPVTFKFADASELKVTKTVGGIDTVLVLVTDYSVTGGGVPYATGNVTMVAGTAGDGITIEGAATETQAQNLTTGGTPSYDALTGMIDRLTTLVQQLKLQTDRSLRIPNTNLPAFVPAMSLAARAGMLVGFDANGYLALTAGNTSDPIRVDLIAFTGGTATCLDSLVTSTLVLNGILTMQPGGPGQGLIRVQLLTSTAAAVAGVIIRPLDYNAVTNPRQWFVVG